MEISAIGVISQDIGLVIALMQWLPEEVMLVPTAVALAVVSRPMGLFAAAMQARYCSLFGKKAQTQGENSINVQLEMEVGVIFFNGWKTISGGDERSFKLFFLSMYKFFGTALIEHQPMKQANPPPRGAPPSPATHEQANKEIGLETTTTTKFLMRALLNTSRTPA